MSKPKTITMIAAAGEKTNWAITAKSYGIYLDDFKRFKQLTTGHHIIMGRKTLLALTNHYLTATHIVITRDKIIKVRMLLLFTTWKRH
jgi:dihydrofolate reductase